MHADVERIVYTEAQISERVKQLGEAIGNDYAGEDLLLVCILRGAAVFTADLARAIPMPVQLDFMAVSSYGNAAESSGEVKLLKDLSEDIKGRNVLICEDILDTGITLERLVEMLKQREPKSIEIAAMFLKEGAQQVDIDCKYVGFEVPNAFMIGYGLDYAEKYRNLPYLGVLKPEVYS